MRILLYKILTWILYQLGTLNSHLYSAWFDEEDSLFNVESISHDEVVKRACSGHYVRCPLCQFFFKPKLGKHLIGDKSAGEGKEEAVVTSSSL